MTEFLRWLVAIFTVGRTVTGSVRHSLGREDKVMWIVELNMAAGSQDGFSLNPTC